MEVRGEKVELGKVNTLKKNFEKNNDSGKKIIESKNRRNNVKELMGKFQPQPTNTDLKKNDDRKKLMSEKNEKWKKVVKASDKKDDTEKENKNSSKVADDPESRTDSGGSLERCSQLQDGWAVTILEKNSKLGGNNSKLGGNNNKTNGILAGRSNIKPSENLVNKRLLMKNSRGRKTMEPDIDGWTLGPNGRRNQLPKEGGINKTLERQ